MPGDEIVADASFSATRAITIDAPPEQVWPWIVQIGYRRAGFYTYDLLDNAGYPSTDTIIPQYQHVQVGNWMPMARTVTETTAFKVTSFETARWLLWEKPDSTWAWQLIPHDGGRTRLISRLKQRYRWQTPGPALLTVVLLEFGDFPMMRRVLTGIKARAESPSSQCSFWYVEALTRAGRLDEARLAFEKMLTYANHVGLFAEQISRTGEQQGNFPQALTHLALISAAFNLDRALG
jgi:hypothetical protein